MKLLRHGPRGAERPGLLDADGIMRDLSAHLSDIDPKALEPQSLARLAAIDARTLPEVDPGARLGPPVHGIGKYVAVGLNYVDHAREANLPVPSEPPLFLKATSCLNGPNDEVMLPMDASKGDWEVELGVVIGRTARYLGETQALAHVAGYVLANDVSERQFQMERGTQWDKGKGCDTFGPVGPWLVTADEVPDPQNLRLYLELNGVRMQDGHTSNMIFSVPALIAYVSRFMTLYPGDLLITGTPAGVGLGQKPQPIFLKPGDEMRLGIERLGEQRQRVVSWRDLAEQRLA